MDKGINIGEIEVGNGAELFLIAGPCVLENERTVFEIARFLKNLKSDLEIPIIFKASYDKANRTSIRSFRGPGQDEGLKMLAEVRNSTGLPVLSDIHSPAEVQKAAEVLDVIQIPAFLCRQTDLVVEAAKSGKPLNIKKGQFLAPWDMRNVVDKAKEAGNRKIMLTERGTLFGYNNLVVDFRGITIMKDLGVPVVFDATHSVQLPGGAGGSSGGQREHAPTLAAAAVAAGADGVFMEIHPDPDNALCDGPNSLTLDTLPPLIRRLKRIRKALRDKSRDENNT